MTPIKDPANMKDFLLRACPPDEKGNRSISRLAEHLGMSAYGVYKWINAGKITPEGAKRLMALTKDAKRPLTQVDLAPFMFGLDG